MLLHGLLYCLHSCEMDDGINWCRGARKGSIELDSVADVTLNQGLSSCGFGLR